MLGGVWMSYGGLVAMCVGVTDFISIDLFGLVSFDSQFFSSFLLILKLLPLTLKHIHTVLALLPS